MDNRQTHLQELEALHVVERARPTWSRAVPGGILWGLLLFGAIVGVSEAVGSARWIIEGPTGRGWAVLGPCLLTGWLISYLRRNRRYAHLLEARTLPRP